MSRWSTPNSCFSPNPLHSVRREEKRREERCLLQSRTFDVMISALRRTAEATTPRRRRRRRRRRANESTELSPHYMCNKRLLFTNVLRATETELPAFRHRQFIIISPAAHARLGSALLCSARCFLPLDFKRKTDRSEELKSVRPMKWCLVSAFGSFPSPRRKNLAAVQSRNHE